MKSTADIRAKSRNFRKDSDDYDDPGGNSPMSPHSSHFSWARVIYIVITIVVLVFAVVLANNFSQRQYTGAAPITTVNKSEYQAVFLTNGQVYFGKVQDITSSYIKMSDIYYLQTQTASGSPAPAPSASANTTSNVALIKLGNEIQGPQDEMTILLPQVLFWENLKAGGKVTQAIDKFQKK